MSRLKTVGKSGSPAGLKENAILGIPVSGSFSIALQPVTQLSTHHTHKSRMGSCYVPMNLHSSPIERPCPFAQMKHLGSWENDDCAADDREDEARVALHGRAWSTMRMLGCPRVVVESDSESEIRDIFKKLRPSSSFMVAWVCAIYRKV